MSGDRQFEYRAGLLSTDALGREVTVTYERGAEHITLTDKLVSVRLHLEANGSRTVEMFFERTRWERTTNPLGLFNQPRKTPVGLKVNENKLVTVR